MGDSGRVRWDSSVSILSCDDVVVSKGVWLQGRQCRTVASRNDFLRSPRYKVTTVADDTSAVGLV